MGSRKLPRDWVSLAPNGIGHQKPHHYREMATVAWGVKGNARKAWSILSKGVCDGCALGVAGFHDWTLDGVHLCTTRLRLLELNCAEPFDHSVLGTREQISLGLADGQDHDRTDRGAALDDRQPAATGHVQVAHDERRSAGRDHVDGTIGIIGLAHDRKAVTELGTQSGADQDSLFDPAQEHHGGDRSEVHRDRDTIASARGDVQNGRDR